MTPCYCWACRTPQEKNPFHADFAGMCLCRDCGNKRCPKAANHENPCSGSNEPGQKGSLYE